VQFFGESCRPIAVRLVSQNARHSAEMLAVLAKGARMMFTIGGHADAGAISYRGKYQGPLAESGRNQQQLEMVCDPHRMRIFDADRQPE
jgi:hypothetical protein